MNESLALLVNSSGVFVAMMVAVTVLLLLAERYLLNYGVCKVDINKGERILEVEGGNTLLHGLLENEIFIPSACGGHGTCGFCKATVTEGGGDVLPTEVTFLSRAEQRAGVRLSCQVKIRNDLKIQIPEDLFNVKMFAGRVISTRSVTHDIKEIRFSCDEPNEINQRPGQYVQIQIPTPDGPVFRAYSISSPASAKNYVELNVRLIPNGVGSTYIHNMKEGDPVNFTGPYGEFHLNEDPDTEIICVGGGAGMAPMKDIIYSIYEKWPDRSVWLFFGCRGTRDVFYLDEYRELAKQHPNFKIKYALSDPLKDGEKWDGETGFIHLSVDKHIQGDTPRQAFLCGPPPMIDAVMKILNDKGLPEKEVFYDKF
ncbi:MAG TPA: 2Fe-2S iron-sulfur cluster binding domain-containing protein [Rectinemataceae bacterium]|nr:2Fe-2S iron-sulfur cluster binding domain-containing protein [Rectinemataceae bacterium]